MEKREYRVICWQPSSSRLDDEIFADIVPANGVIHDMIFYSRLKIFRGTQPNLTIRDVAKSVYLTVIDDVPEIVFAQPTDVSQERLQKIILNTYHRMRADNRHSTLDYTMSAPETEAYADQIKQQKYEDIKYQQQLTGHKIRETDEEIFARREREKRGLFAQKHLSFPQTPQEERLKQNNEDLALSVKHHQEAQQMHAQLDKQLNPLMRLRLRYQHDGD